MVHANRPFLTMLWTLLVLVAIAPMAAGQANDAPPATPPATVPTTIPAGPAGAMARYIEPAVPLVARVDLERVDTPAIARWLADIIATIEPDPALRDADVTGIHDTMARVGAFTDGLRQAGAKELYVMLAMIRNQPAPVAFFTPVTPQNAEAIRQQLQTLGNPNTPQGMRAELLDGVVAVAPLPLLNRLRPGVADMTNAVQLNAALERTSGAAAQLVLLTGPNTQPILQQVLFSFPGLGAVAQPTTQPGVDPPPATDFQPQRLPADIRWAVLAMQSPPKESAEIWLQSVDAEAAVRVQSGLRQLLELLGKDPGSVRNADRLAETLVFKVQGDQLVTRLTGEQLGQVIKQDVGPLLSETRLQGRRAEAANQIRRICQTIGFYASSHGQKLPTDLGVLVTELGAPPAMLKNAQQPSRDIGYVYIRPCDTIQQLTGPQAKGLQLVLVHEAYDQWPGGVQVGFVDGRVEYVQDEAVLKQLVEETKAFATSLAGGGADIGPMPQTAPANSPPAR
jgi:hypothetical protein